MDFEAFTMIPMWGVYSPGPGLGWVWGGGVPAGGTWGRIEARKSQRERERGEKEGNKKGRKKEKEKGKKGWGSETLE